MENGTDSPNGTSPAENGEPGDPTGRQKSVSQLTAKQEAAIAALVGETTCIAAAKSAGVTDRTLRRWMKGDAAFRQRLREARANAFEGAIRTLHAASSEAAGILQTIARDGEAAQGARVAAARALLHYSCRGREIAEMDDRMAALEDKIAEMSIFLDEKSEWRQD